MKPIITLLLVIMATTGFTQDSTWHTLHKFRLDIKGGFGDVDKNASNSNVQSYGYLLGIEPDINITDYTSAGLHYNYFEAFNGHDQEVSRKRNHLIMAGLTLRSPSRFTDKGWWLAGLNAGANFYTNKVDTAFFPLHANRQQTYSGTRFAFMPHCGLQYGRFVLDAAYLLSGNTGNHYFIVSLGFYVGSGKNK
ncbi:MAG TPA: hypothetical protein VG738_12420 [Chitinophagaceae bacterium]|nr:hypothetical protein [Chitinophagaceae bacterium]